MQHDPALPEMLHIHEAIDCELMFLVSVDSCIAASLFITPRISSMTYKGLHLTIKKLGVLAFQEPSQDMGLGSDRIIGL